MINHNELFLYVIKEGKECNEDVYKRQVERRVSVLMGDKVEPRREWIEQNVQFTLEDNFTID